MQEIAAAFLAAQQRTARSKNFCEHKDKQKKRNYQLFMTAAAIILLEAAGMDLSRNVGSFRPYYHALPNGQCDPTSQHVGAMMKSTRHILLVGLLILGTPPAALAVRSPVDTNLEEINHHQAGAASALLLGDHSLLEQGAFGFSGQIHVSGWATDAIYGAWGLSLQAHPGRRLGVGLSYGYTDAQVRTHVWLLNGQYSLVDGPEPWLRVQAAVGHQHLDSSESGNVAIFEFDDPWPVRPDNPQILVDDMNWTHGLINLLASTRLWLFRPQVSLGYVFSHYSWSGWEVPAFGGLEAGPGPAISDSGSSETATWSLGLGLDLDPVRPFVGMGAFSGGGLFLARVSIVF